MALSFRYFKITWCATAAYGGPLENRVRFLREAVEALISVWGADRVGVRISPSGEWGDVSDSNPEATFSYVAEVLNEYKIAYLHVIEPRIKGDETLHEGHPPVAVAYLRPHFTGPIIAAGGFDGVFESRSAVPPETRTAAHALCPCRVLGW
jgi:N-ethylmaleimide reductase